LTYGQFARLPPVVLSPICALSAALASLPPRRRSSVDASDVVLDRGCAPRAGDDGGAAWHPAHHLQTSTVAGRSNVPLPTRANHPNDTMRAGRTAHRLVPGRATP